MAAVMHLFISCELREHFDLFSLGSNISPTGSTPSASAIIWICIRVFRYLAPWLVDAPVGSHGVEGLGEGIHHGVSEHLGSALAVTLHSMAVHLECQVLVDLPVDEGKHLRAHLMICRAVCDPCHLECLHWVWRLTPPIQVVETHMERPDLQQGIHGNWRGLCIP